MENWNLEYANVDDFLENQKKIGLYVWNKLNQEFLIEAIKWNPKYFLADIFETYLGAFKLWELFRKSTSYIQIKTIRKRKNQKYYIGKKR